jgi:hypothetical protein
LPIKKPIRSARINGDTKSIKRQHKEGEKKTRRLLGVVIGFTLGNKEDLLLLFEIKKLYGARLTQVLNETGH